MKDARFVVLMACLAVLSGCDASGEDELRQWMAELRASTKPHVTPIEEPKNSSHKNTLPLLSWILSISAD